jgi:hypothetical protein
MMAASTNGSTSKDSSVPELESRREQKTPREAAATPALRADRVGAGVGAAPSSAIYLIEREAIRLRRLRWTDSHRLEGGKAPAQAADAEATNPSLAKYARPRPPDSRSPTKKSLLGRIRDWLQQILFGE